MHDDGFDVVGVVALMCLMFVGGCMTGVGVTSDMNEKRLVESGLAHYDQKTREFTLHEPCLGTED